MSDEVFGDVVEVRKPMEVSMVADGESVTAKVSIADDENRWGIPEFHIKTDFDTARRMVDGEVSVVFVVSDGGEAES